MKQSREEAFADFERSKEELKKAIGETPLMQFLVKHAVVVVIICTVAIATIFTLAFLGIIPTETR